MVEDEKTPEQERNPYAYLDRGDFTSEKYKVEIRGLPKYYGIAEFRRFMNDKLDLQPCKFKPPRRSSGWLYVCFRNEEGRQRAISVINGTSWKNCSLTAQVAKPAPDPFVKRKLEEDGANKRLKTEDSNVPPATRVKLTTTPLWDTPYPNQLELKQVEMKQILTDLCKEMLKESKDTKDQKLWDWINAQKNRYDGLPCELLPIQHSDKVNEYRNKCEFTIGRNTKEEKVIIGFRLSSYAAGSTAVGPLEEVEHIPQKMKIAVKILEEFIENSGLEPFEPVTHDGHWSQVTARTTKLDDLMLILEMHRHQLSSEKLEELKVQLKEFFESGKGAEAHVTSLYLQSIEKKGRAIDNKDTLWHISGKQYIEEELLDMKFRISPHAFFQVNTSAAQVLYQKAIDLAQPTMDSALLDVCCGTGTIGLIFSKHCGEVFGIEIIDDAVKDARENARVNNVTNCEFFVGKAEDTLLPVIRRTTKSDIVAVVDPPRAGLHHKALVTLRKADKLKRLVYISCDPRAAMKNLVDLSRPTSKQYSKEPLVPVKAVAVDMFPHTKHCELIVCLERLSEATKAQDSSS